MVKSPAGRRHLARLASRRASQLAHVSQLHLRARATVILSRTAASIGTSHNVIASKTNCGPGTESAPARRHERGFFALTVAVPEPSTWAMMILGFTGVGYLAYVGSRSPL